MVRALLAKPSMPAWAPPLPAGAGGAEALAALGLLEHSPAGAAAVMADLRASLGPLDQARTRPLYPTQPPPRALVMIVGTLPGSLPGIPGRGGVASFSLLSCCLYSQRAPRLWFLC